MFGFHSKMEFSKIPRPVTIMAVTKGVSVNKILPILKKESITLIGESRWQEAKEKIHLLPKNIEKHFIGHLQTNKAQEVTEHFDCIESVDSLKLAKAINTAAVKQNKIMPIFLQVNISNDVHKYGISVSEINSVVHSITELNHLKLTGLMTITADDQSSEKTRSDFRSMKQLQQKYALPELSMGMSNDWKIAIEEGATIVRLGRALFHAS